MDSTGKIGKVYLQLHKPGNRWRSVLLALFPAGSSGEARLEILDMGGLGGDVEDDQGSAMKIRHQLLRHQKPKVVRLCDVNSVVKMPAHADASPAESMSSFCVGTQDRTLVFAALRDQSDDWVRKLHDCTFQEASANQRLMEENQIYSSVEEVPEFLVVVQKSDAAARCGLQGSYWLQVTLGSLQLRDTKTRSLIREWPFELLRRYGKDKLVFTIEAGRRCASGPGTFNFETEKAENIFLLIQGAIKGKSTSSPRELTQEGERPPLTNRDSPSLTRAPIITSMPLPSLPSFSSPHQHSEHADPVYALPEEALRSVSIPQASAPLYVDPADILPLKPPTLRKDAALPSSSPSQPAFDLDNADSVYSEVLDSVNAEHSLMCSKGQTKDYDEPIYTEPLNQREISPQTENKPDPFAHLYAQVCKTHPSAPPPSVGVSASRGNVESADDVIYENLGII